MIHIVSPVCTVNTYIGIYTYNHITARLLYAATRSHTCATTLFMFVPRIDTVIHQSNLSSCFYLHRTNITHIYHNIILVWTENPTRWPTNPTYHLLLDIYDSVVSVIMRTCNLPHIPKLIPHPIFSIHITPPLPISETNSSITCSQFYWYQG